MNTSEHPSDTMTTATEIDRIIASDPHPIYSLIGRQASSLIHVVRRDGRYRWVKTPEASTTPCGELPCDRLGVILYDYTTGESLGAGLDIDGASHGQGLTPEQLAEIKSRRPECVSLEVTSTSGTGLHVYILWTAPVKCSPEEHRGLCQRAGIEYERALDLPYRVVDVSRNMLWTYAVDKGPGAFVGTPTTGRLDPLTLPELPTLPGKQGEAPPELDDASRDLMARAKGTPYACSWDDQIKALKVHKGLLVELQQHYPGQLKTDSRCTDPASANCWLRRADGHWDVYCWGGESTWTETTNGYRYTTFGKAPEFSAANKAGTPESPNCSRHTDPTTASEAVRSLTGKLVNVPDALKTPGRQFDVVNKSGVIQLRAIKSHNTEACPADWCSARGYFWIGAESPNAVTPETLNRVQSQFYQTKQDKKLTGMFRYSGSSVPVAHTREQAYSVARTLVGDKALKMIDHVTAHPVELVCEAFAPVIQPGKLNVGPQFTVTPQKGKCDTWLRMLIRLGSSLTPALTDPTAQWAEWVRLRRMTSGGRWLLWWVAYLCQRPTQRLPIVAFVGQPDDGKSTFGDALETLWDKSGTSDAGELLRTRSQFTGNVAQSILGRIEDCDISKRDQLLRLTPWVTSPHLMAEHKHQTPFAVPNQLHLIVTSNNPDDIPIRDKDCRIVLIQTEPLGTDRDVEFADKLLRERAAFLFLAQSIKLPEGSDRYSRLAIPDILTDAKGDAAESNRTTAEVFADECLITDASSFVSNGDLYGRYREWVSDTGRVRDCDSSQELSKALGSWFTLRGVQASRTNSERGRKGIKVTA